MTELRKAAEMALEEFETQVEHHSGAYLAIDALRQALDQLPDATKMIEPSISLIENEWAGLKESPNSTKHVVESEQREWVGLTDKEIAEAVGSPIDEVYLADFRKVMAKIKEKNHE